MRTVQIVIWACLIYAAILAGTSLFFRGIDGDETERDDDGATDTTDDGHESTRFSAETDAEARGNAGKYRPPDSRPTEKGDVRHGRR